MTRIVKIIVILVIRY